MSGITTMGYSTASGSVTAVSGCSCPVCQGLQTFSSPLYASGALLTADDLSSEQAFVRAKMRLHNRYLHGWGAVCGLQVVCDDCNGWVRINPGYAIDPCGNDLVLAAATPFNVVKAIQDCAAKRPKIGACDPYVPPPDPGCQDTVSYWCVTLKFNELQTAQTAQFMRQAVASGGCATGGGCSCGSGGGCSCGSAGGGCSCGGQTSAAASSSAGALSYISPNCTPRRLLECVEIGIEPHEGPCAPALGTPFEFATLAPPGSLLGRIIACLKDAVAILGARLVSSDAAALESLGTGQNVQGVTTQGMHDALCRLRQGLIDFLTRHDPVRCQMLAATAATLVPDVIVNGQQLLPAEYAKLGKPVLGELMFAWLQAAADCICGALLPSCPSDPVDLRVPIACVTVRGGRIVDICNHACRRYAGSFPSLFYWLSLVPVVPILSQLIARICCAPDVIDPQKAGQVEGLINTVDPAGAWRRTLFQDRFAMPAMMLRTMSSIDLPTLFASLKPTQDPVAVNAVIGQRQQEAVDALREQHVTAYAETVADPAALQVKLNTLSSGVAPRGGQVKLLVHNDVVVGVAPISTSGVETEALHKQIADLGVRVANLEAGAAR
jgi:hypothetical protein